jgi:hypothetical protein
MERKGTRTQVGNRSDIQQEEMEEAEVPVLVPEIGSRFALPLESIAMPLQLLHSPLALFPPVDPKLPWWSLPSAPPTPEMKRGNHEKGETPRKSRREEDG